LIVAVAMVLMPGIMAFTHYVGNTGKAEPKGRAIGLKKHVAISNV
jgi:hypothetical protein